MSKNNSVIEGIDLQSIDYEQLNALKEELHNKLTEINIYIAEAKEALKEDRPIDKDRYHRANIARMKTLRELRTVQVEMKARKTKREFAGVFDRNKKRIHVGDRVEFIHPNNVLSVYIVVRLITSNNNRFCLKKDLDDSPALFELSQAIAEGCEVVSNGQ